MADSTNQAAKENKEARETQEAIAALNALIQKGRKDGTIQASELTSLLEKRPDLSPDDIEQIYESFDSMGIQIVGNELELDLDLDLDGGALLPLPLPEEEEEELTKKSEEITEVFKKAVNNDKITVKVEKLKNEDIASMITVSEESRRMQDMMKMYAMPGMDMGAMGREGETLVLNANNQLVSYVLDNKEGENVELICEQLYDLALLQQAPLQPEAMTKFISRSNKIMMLLTKS